MKKVAGNDHRSDPAPHSIVRAGANCWKRVSADKMGIVVDAEEYFLALAEGLARAQRSILMLGWEFDSRTQLVRGSAEAPFAGRDLPTQIGPLLDALVRRSPGLTVNVLIWDSSLLYAINREFAGLVKMDWLTHPRMRFRLDDSHPLGASHHQKIVVIDDALAFVGGLDVTSQRWDSRAHARGDPRRTDPAAPRYPPFHDVMAVVTGEIAVALGDLCRTRWRACTGETLSPPARADGDILWPGRVQPLFSAVQVAIARTFPSWDGEPAVREVERLYLDMIAAARRLIFIENQYFASRRIGAAIAARLAAPDCPEIIVIGPGYSVSIMERSSMGVARIRVAQRLRQSDMGGKFTLYCPTVDGDDVKVHSKIMVVDDSLLRVGSSNLNNRSMRLDTECDLVLEANGDPSVQQGIRRFRQDLLAEHLGVPVAAVASAEMETGSIRRCIAGLSGGRRTLMPIDFSDPGEILRIVADSKIPDPEEPMETMVWLDEALPGPARRPLVLRIRTLTALLAGLAVAGALWRLAPEQIWTAAQPWVDALVALRSHPAALGTVTALFTLGALLRIPVSVLVLSAAAASGLWLGSLGSIAGALASASFHYLLGAALGRRRVRRLSGWKVNRVSRALSRHGIAAMVLLRLMPVGAFAVINMVAGSARVVFLDFILGTAIGMAPGVFAMSVLGDRLLAVLRNPSVANIAVLALATALVIGAVRGLVNRLGRARAPKIRQPKEG